MKGMYLFRRLVVVVVVGGGIIAKAAKLRKERWGRGVVEV